MNNVFVLFIDSRLVGVYTTHRKAAQDMFMETLPFEYQMVDYTYDMGIEFYTFRNKEDKELVYEIQEITPDGRV